MASGPGDHLRIPSRLEAAIIFSRGEQDGRRWLAELPGHVSTYCERWGLSPTGIADNGALSCCVYCKDSADLQLVLKIPTDPDAGLLETRALEHWEPSAAGPQVIAVDRHTGIFLMTRILPGAMARPVRGLDDTRSFIDLLGRLQAPSLCTLEGVPPQAEVVRMRLDWADERFASSGSARDARMAQSARNRANRLLGRRIEGAILHGDLQAKNILVGPSGRWFAIDPFVCRGDVHADAAFWAVMQDGPTSIAERLEQLADNSNLALETLHEWAQVFAVAELRPVLPESAQRMRRYLRECGLA